MTTDLANNSRLGAQLPGAPKFLLADYDNPNLPLEKQIRASFSTTANTNASASKIVPDTNFWKCTDNPTAATVAYTLTLQDVYNLGNRRVTLCFDGTRHAANSVSVTLPVGARFVVTGEAAFHTVMTITPNVYVAVDLVFGELCGGTVDVAVVGDTTGFVWA